MLELVESLGQLEKLRAGALFAKHEKKDIGRADLVVAVCQRANEPGSFQRFAERLGHGGKFGLIDLELCKRGLQVLVQGAEIDVEMPQNMKYIRIFVADQIVKPVDQLEMPVAGILRKPHGLVQAVVGS